MYLTVQLIMQRVKPLCRILMSVVARNRLPNFPPFSRTRHDFPKKFQRRTLVSVSSTMYIGPIFHATTNTATQYHECAQVLQWRTDISWQIVQHLNILTFSLEIFKFPAYDIPAFFISTLPIVIPVKLHRRICDTVTIFYQLEFCISLMHSVAVCPPKAITNFKYTKEHAIITLFCVPQQCFDIPTNTPAQYL